MTRLSRLLLLGALLMGPNSLAQQWAQPMFNHLAFDFGTVARGAKAEHHFSFQNIYQEDIQVVSVTSSCHCTKPTVTKSVLKKLETADVVATIDTENFYGSRHATVTVKFAGFKAGLPFSGEVNLDVSVTIRGDVVVQPGVVDFGAVPQGIPTERKTTIAYAGRPDWQITAVENNNPSLDVRYKEAGRSIQQVNYELTVSVKPNANPGYIHDQVVLITNDPNPRTARVPVPIEGMIMAGVTVRPTPLLLGVVTPGASVTRSLVVQSQTPLRITAVTCSDPRFRFEIPTLPGAIHLITVHFTADTSLGNVMQTVQIGTDVAGTTPLSAAIQVNVVAAAVLAPTPSSSGAHASQSEPKTGTAL